MKYFPKESFIPIDILDCKRSREIISSVIANNEYYDRLPYIIEARNRVLKDQNIFAILDRIISEQETRNISRTYGKVIRNRSSARLINPLTGIKNLAKKIAIKSYHRLSYPIRNRPKRL